MMNSCKVSCKECPHESECSELVTLDQLEFSTCRECGHSDLDINETCWRVNGRFGEYITPDTEICQAMYDELVAKGRFSQDNCY